MQAIRTFTKGGITLSDLGDFESVDFGNAKTGRNIFLCYLISACKSAELQRISCENLFMMLHKHSGDSHHFFK